MPGLRKLYYSIREVSEMTELQPHVLRYWEGEFEALAPRKNRAGNRAYTDADIAVVRRIQRLLHEERYTIEGARQVLERHPAGNAGVTGTDRQRLTDLRAFLSDLLQGL